MKLLTRIKERPQALALILAAIILAGVTFSFTEHVKDLNRLAHTDCDLPASICPFETFFPMESVIGYIASFALFLIGGYWFFRPDKPSVVAAINSSPLKQGKQFPSFSKLIGDEKIVAETLKEAGGLMFQSELVEITGLSKVKMTRILDKLESRDFIERKRRGMTNVVSLKTR